MNLNCSLKLKLSVFAFMCGLAPMSALQAFELGAIGGIQTTDVTTDATDASVSSDFGIRAGVLGFAEITSNSFIRTGAIIGQRKFKFTQAAAETKADFLYLEVPVTFLYLFTENVGVYAGVEAGIRLSDDCSTAVGSCSFRNPSSFIYGPSLGGHFRFTPNLGMEVGYFFGLNEMVEGATNFNKFENPQGLQVSALFIF